MSTCLITWLWGELGQGNFGLVCEFDKGDIWECGLWIDWFVSKLWSKELFAISRNDSLGSRPACSKAGGKNQEATHRSRVYLIPGQWQCCLRGSGAGNTGSKMRARASGWQGLCSAQRGSSQPLLGSPPAPCSSWGPISSLSCLTPFLLLGPKSLKGRACDVSIGHLSCAEQGPHANRSLLEKLTNLWVNKLIFL